VKTPVIRWLRLVAVIALAIGCGKSQHTGSDAGGDAAAGASGAAGAHGGAGGVAGANGGAAGGTTGTGAGGAAGTGGVAGVGGAAGAGRGGGGGIGGAGTAGAAAGGTGGAGGGGGGALAVTAALDGQKYLMPCGPTKITTGLWCDNIPASSTTGFCSTTGPFLTRGNLMRDETITIGGTPGAIYDVTLRVRGVIEPKHYQNGAPGTPANGTNYGWYVGGEPNPGGDYGKYMLWVSAPVVMQTGTLDGQYYFLNAINHTEAFAAYPTDYTVTLPIAAGAQVRFLADDSNCTMVKNCDDTSVDNQSNPPLAICNQITVAGLPASAGIAQPYPGQFIYLTVISAVMR